jgi:hypothetical protein
VAAPLQPNVRFTFRLEKVPASAGTTVYRWSNKPLADAAAWAEGRVESFGSIERALSTNDGDYDIATTDLTLTDSDGALRTLLTGVQTRYFTAREGAIELLSYTGRWAGTAWRTLFRGRVTDVQPVLGRKLRMRLADEVGSHFSGFDLDKTLGIRITRREHPNAGDAVVNRIYPIGIGEHSDFGTTDENGNAADKGLLPVIDTGDYVLMDDGSDTPEDAAVQYLAAPQNLEATVNGTPGTRTRTYGVTAVSPYGETTMATVLVTTAADSLTPTDNVTLSWDEQDGAIEYRVYVIEGDATPTNRLAVLNNNETWSDPETEYEDDGTDSASAHAPPVTNTAAVDQVINGTSASGWGRLVGKLGEGEIHHLYASDLATDTAPKRVRMGEEVYGTEFLVPGRPGWPHDEDYIEINGIRMFVFYARGPRLKHHRDGVVTIAWNGCGDPGANGETITETFPAAMQLLDTHLLKASTTAEQTGSLETFSNSVAKLKASAFEDCQALTAEWIGGEGYQAAFWITEPISLREWLRRFAVTFACRWGSNHHGQVFPVLVDDTADPTDGRLYRDKIDIRKAVSQEIADDEVETRVVYHYDYDTDAQRFRIADQVIEDTVATTAHKGVRQRGVRQCYYTRDEATAQDSNARHLARHKVAPHRFGIETDLTGLEDELGSQVRIQHYDDIYLGTSAAAYLVEKHKVNPNNPETVTLTCLDLSRLLDVALPLLEDETTMAANLYSEDVYAPPPAGAYELR